MKQEVEAEDHLGACGGGGNLTFTFLTNPPVTKTHFTAQQDSALAPRPPKTCCLQFPYSCCKGEEGHSGLGRPRGDKEDRKVLGFFFYFYYLKETREGSK